MKRLILFMGLVVLLPAVAVAGVLDSDFVRPVGVVASNYYDTPRQAIRTIDGSGLNASGEHGSSAANTMWMTLNGATTRSIEFDLGAEIRLDGFHLWNHNQAGYTDRGIRDAELRYSLDGVTWSSPETMTLTQADSTTTYAGEDYVLAAPVVARYVEITSTGTFGSATNYVGLSEVRFTTPTHITGVTATASSQYDASRTATKTVNDAGMSGFGLERADTNASNMWMTANNHVAGESITFDLQEAHQLGATRIWNFNQFAGSTSYSRRGIQTFDIEVSLDNSTWQTLTGPLAGGHFGLNQAPGTAGYLEADMIDLGGVLAQWVRFTVIDNFLPSDAYVGLSEVRFYETTPEPSTVVLLATLGLAGLGLARWRRRRRAG